MDYILVINPGSTSTKIAIFEDETKILSETLRHKDEELTSFNFVMDQVEYRKNMITSFLREKDFDVKKLTCVMARGGQMPFIPFGGYRVDEKMIDYLKGIREGAHISNIACVIAYGIAEEIGIPAYIYDCVHTDELAPIAKITGIPELPKFSRGHALNSHAMVVRCAKEVMHKPVDECTFIVLHLGGGCSVWLFDKGRAIDMYSDDDAGFCPERCGRIQALDLIHMCYSGRYTYGEMAKKARGNSGIRALLGTSDMIEVEKRVQAGDEEAKLVYDAFIYGYSKSIGDLATAVKGKVDRIILTGGIAYSDMVCEKITEYVDWIAPVERMPGEYEMEALAQGGLRILRGEEKTSEIDYGKKIKFY